MKFHTETTPTSVLVVDDDPAVREALTGVLDMNGYRVVVADSRKSGLQVLEERTDVSVIILDLGMPPEVHSTAEGLAVIKASTAMMHPAKIVVLTGQDHEQSAFEAIREGAFDFLSKPASVDDILQAVRRAVLFYRKEQALAAEGTTRLHLNAKVTDGLKAVRKEAEEMLVRQVLKDTGFNIYASAALLGLKRESMYYFLKKFEITRDNS
jgi:DNA-binding NtrC family response regulator